MSASPTGFALRTSGLCQADEVDCGHTVVPYRGCCPESTFCPTSYNLACCPGPGNCTSALLQDPQCANREWNLYDNAGYFCCEQGLQGYASTTNSDGCAGPGHKFRSGERLLGIISSGQVATQSSTTTSSSSTTTSSHSQTSTSMSTSAPAAGIPCTGDGCEVGRSSSPTSNAGPIVGGVIGGVALILIAVIAWVVLRRRRAKKVHAPPMDDSNAVKPPEIDGLQIPSELPIIQKYEDHTKRTELHGRHVLTELE